VKCPITVSQYVKIRRSAVGQCRLFVQACSRSLIVEHVGWLATGNHKLNSVEIVEIVKMDRDSLVYKGKGCFTVLHGSRWMLFL
jgi:hypothetical protein